VLWSDGVETQFLLVDELMGSFFVSYDLLLNLFPSDQSGDGKQAGDYLMIEKIKPGADWKIPCANRAYKFSAQTFFKPIYTIHSI